MLLKSCKRPCQEKVLQKADIRKLQRNQFRSKKIKTRERQTEKSNLERESRDGQCPVNETRERKKARDPHK